MRKPEFFTVPVTGGDMTVARWGSGPRIVLGIHGITASSMLLLPIARRLGPEFTLVAPDLRGRGASASLPGPFGMRAHAADCAAVLETLGSRAVVCGVSMGGFVSLVLGAQRPDLIERLVLVDGGYPFRLPPGIDRETFLANALGPALQRLKMTFPSREAYVDFWRAHPALGEEWNDDVLAYVEYDATGTPPQVRSRVNAAAVIADNQDLVGDEGVVHSALARLGGLPGHLLRATRNLLNETPPLYPDPLMEEWRRAVPNLTDEVVEDTNHYTIVFGERGAKTIVERIEKGYLS